MLTNYNSVQKYTLVTAAMASFLTPFMGSAVNLAIPSIGREFNSGALLLSWVATSYILASAAFLVPIGRFADMVGRKKIFIVGISFFSLSSALCSLAWSVQALIAFRVLQGFGSAMIFGTATAILTSAFPPQDRGKVLGINVASVYIGLSLGPVLGGILNHNFGWEYIFYFTTLISIAAIFTGVTKLKGEWRGNKGEKFDTAGALLYSFGIVAIMYGISTVNDSAWAKYLIILGFVLMTLFIKHELKIKHPILNIRLFSRNRLFALSNLAALINYSATFGITFLLSLYLQIIMKFDSQTAGFILLSQPVLMALLSPFAGYLSDKMKPQVVASWGMTLTTLALSLFCFLSAETPLWLVVLNLAVLGSGIALFSSPNTNAVMGSVEKKFYGVASSIIGTMRLSGQTVSMAVVTLLLASHVGSVELNEASPLLLMKGIRKSMIVFSVICFAGIFASLARTRGVIGESKNVVRNNK